MATDTGPREPTGIVAVDKVGGHVLFLDPVTLETTATLTDFPPKPHEIAMSPDGRFAYISIYGDGIHGNNPHPGKTLSVIDLVGRRQLGEIDLGSYEAPHGSEFGPDGLLYVACENSGVVVGIDTATRKIVSTTEIGSKNCHRISLQPSKMICWTENEEDPTASVLDLRLQQRVAEVSIANGSAGITISPDESTVVIVDAKEPLLHVIDTATRLVTRTVRLDGHDGPAQIIRWSPNGRHVVVTSYPAPVGTVLDANLESQKLLHLGKGPMNMAFHPNGRIAIIANHDAGTVAETDLEQGAILRTVPAGRGIENLMFF